MTVSYFVNYRKQGDATWSRWPSDGSTLNTLSTVVGQNPPGPALAPSQAYEFEVIATNAFGSATSTISSGTTTSGVAFQSIVLNPAAPTFTAGFTGTIASVVVTMTSGSFTGTLAVTTGNANFSIVNGQLQVTNANLAAGPQSFTIQATQSTATNTPYSQGFTVQVGAALAESAEATVVKTTGQTIIASRTMRVPSNGPFNYWQLTSGAQIQLSTDGTNYSVQPSTSGVTALLYHKDSLFQLNSGGLWWYWNTSTSDATPGTPGYVFYNLTGPVALSTPNYPAGAAPGTWTATISCPMASNAANDTFPGTWGGTFTLDAASAATFSITGSTITNKVTLNQNSYSPTITAALNVTGSDSTVYSVGHTISTQIGMTVSGSFVAVPLNAYLGNGWGNYGQYASALAHWQGISSAYGVTPTGISGTTLQMTSATYGGTGTNDNASTNVSTSNWVTGIAPPGGVRTSLGPIMPYMWTNGTINNAFTAYASGTYDTYIQGQIQTYFNAGWRKIYFRFNWEWNQNFQGGGIGTTGNQANFLNCWRHFSNVCHTKGNAIGIQVKTVWCPAISNLADTPALNLPVYSYFPQPDSNAVAGSDGVTKRYVDVIAPDVYAWGGIMGYAGTEFGMVDTAWQTGQIWCFDTCAKIASNWNIPVGICEFNDFYPRFGNAPAYQGIFPNQFIPYMNNLKNMAPNPVPIEFITPYDLPFFDANSQWSWDSFNNGNLSCARQMFGSPLGAISGFATMPTITTIAVP